MSFINEVKIPFDEMDLVIKSKYLKSNKWEYDFIESIHYKCFFRGKYYVSEKQKNVFDKILSKVKAFTPGVNSIGEKYREVFREFEVGLDPIDEAHLSAYNHVYKENDNIKKGFDMMMKKYGIKRK